MATAQSVNLGLMAVALILLVAWNRPRAQAPKTERATGARAGARAWPVRAAAAAPGAAEAQLLVEHLRTGVRLRSELNGVTVGTGARRSASVITYGYVENRFRIAAWIQRFADLARGLAVDEELLARLDSTSAGFSDLPATRLATAFDECLAAGATIAEHASKLSRQTRSVPTVPSGPTSTPSPRSRSRIRNWKVDHAPRRPSNMR